MKHSSHGLIVMPPQVGDGATGLTGLSSGLDLAKTRVSMQGAAS
ncbi:MAG: hypothetical protein V7763_10460 [Sulfitobacter sp.]